MMQEIKTEDINFPYDDFSSMDYESYVFGQKSYNGVAIISKGKLKNIRTDLIKDKLKQSRIISAEIEYKKKIVQLINIYTPNGNPVDTEKYDYKKNWMDQLIKQLKTLSKKNSNIILAGDFNVIPAAEDVYNVKSFEDDVLYIFINWTTFFLYSISAEIILDCFNLSLIKSVFILFNFLLEIIATPL